jgi:capsid protein
MVGILNRFTRYLGYDATEAKNRRQAPSSILRSEDDELLAEKRRRLVSGVRDIQRNFAVAAWAIRKHLDFVSSFTFDAKTGIDGFDEDLEAFMESWQDQCDVAGRHPLPRLIRLSEARSVVDGDVLIVKLASGQIQAIEADRIKSQIGQGGPSREWVHGVRVNPSGRALGYAIHRRWGDRLEYERTVPAANAHLHAYYERIDQVRGISPIASGFNTLRDCYEGFDYALAKAKIAAMFGLVLYRDAIDAAAPVTADSTDQDGPGCPKPGYEIDFGKGPVMLDLDPGDKAEFLENKTPPTEFQEFSRLMISVALKSIDIPYSFFDESFTNFFGSRAALMLYIKSAKTKQDNLRALLRGLTNWRLRLAVMDGDITLPRGMDVSQIEYEWIPDGVPWWDPAKEIAGDIAAIGSTLRSRREIRKERYGDDWFRVVDELAEENEYLAAKGVTPSEPQVVASVGEQPQQNGGQDDDD